MNICSCYSFPFIYIEMKEKHETTKYIYPIDNDDNKNFIVKIYFLYICKMDIFLHNLSKNQVN